MVVDLAGWVYSGGKVVTEFKKYRQLTGDWDSAVVLWFDEPNLRIKCSSGVSFVNAQERFK